MSHQLFAARRQLNFEGLIAYGKQADAVRGAAPIEIIMISGLKRPTVVVLPEYALINTILAHETQRVSGLAGKLTTPVLIITLCNRRGRRTFQISP
jgi:hypothetical protein